MTRRGAAIVTALFLLFLALPELVLSGADLGIWGKADLRLTAYEWGAFWPGLLADWTPLFSGQAWVMFLTYGLIHEGPAHLAVNGAGLVAFMPGLLRRHGLIRTAVVYGLGQIAGALVFTMLAPAATATVGASGAIFALAGATMAAGEGRWSTPNILIVLCVVLLADALGGLAWQVHLGGCAAGLLLGAALRR
ncbi:MAG: rhomboid family intramembrane serine protease [Rhodobacteraceae bacterium]|nr:rhomboid family intramembrane serine protease [Paracoccaceae bacterium]